MTDLMFDVDGATLAGTLTLPAAPGPHPGVVMVGGSGPSDRDNDVLFPPIRAHLVAAGLAVLSYDKRGVGGSTGSWLDSGVAELAGDATAALRVLRAHPEVDAGAVGLFGHSEGGWVVLRAAARRPDGIAWVVTNSGPGVGPVRQERFALGVAARAAGHGEDEVAAAEAFFDRVVASARADAGFAEVDALLRADPGHALFESFGVRLDAPTWAMLRRYVDHDPAPDVAALRCPHLALFGAADRIVPVVDSVAAFTAAAGDRGLTTIEVLPDGDHRIQVDGATRFAPRYLATLTHWITTR